MNQQRILGWVIKRFRFIFTSPSVKSSFFTTISDKFTFTMTGDVAFVLHTKDLAISRRIYTGSGLEHLKTLKAIKLIENEFSGVPSGGGQSGSLNT